MVDVLDRKSANGNSYSTVTLNWSVSSDDPGGVSASTGSGAKSQRSVGAAILHSSFDRYVCGTSVLARASPTTWLLVYAHDALTCSSSVGTHLPVILPPRISLVLRS